MISSALQPDRQRMVGDVLLDLRAHTDGAAVRMRDMQRNMLDASPTQHLHIIGEGASWRGFPLLTCALAEWDVALLGELHEVPTIAALEAQLTRALGSDAGAAGLNGHFLLIAHHRHSGEWQVLTDRFGTIHAYLTEVGGCCIVGTCFRSVAGISDRAQLDREALAAFCMIGFQPGDRTLVEGVRMLRPATRTVLDASGRLVSQGRYWEWTHNVDATLTRDEAVESFAAVWQDVVTELTGVGRVAVPLSGGLDSRCAAAALCGQAGDADRLLSYSYGYTPDSIEIRIARQVAEAAGLPFHAHVIERTLLDDIELIDAALEGFQDVTQARQVAVRSLLREEADVVLGAHWGDVWMDALDAEYTKGMSMLEVALDKVRKPGREHLQQLLFDGSGMRMDAEEVTRELLRSELARIPDFPDAAFRFTAFKTEQWSFRWTLASLRMYQCGAWTRLPFYDNRVTDLMATLPSDFVRGRRLQIDYLKRHHPSIARVEWQGFAGNLFEVDGFNTRLLPRRAWRKLLRTLRPAYDPASNWRHQFHTATEKRRLAEMLHSSDSPLRSITDAGMLHGFLDASAARNWDAGRGYAHSMLLTLHQSLQHLPMTAWGEG